MSKMFAIADRLGDLYKAQRGVQIELSHQEQDLAARVLALTPADGWTGKNEGERKTAKEIAVAGDGICQRINQRITELRDNLADNEGEISALVEQRDALRWTATAKLADALEAKYIGRKEIATAEAIDEALDVTELRQPEPACADDLPTTARLVPPRRMRSRCPPSLAGGRAVASDKHDKEHQS